MVFPYVIGGKGEVSVGSIEGFVARPLSGIWGVDNIALK